MTEEVLVGENPDETRAPQSGDPSDLLFAAYQEAGSLNDVMLFPGSMNQFATAMEAIGDELLLAGEFNGSFTMGETSMTHQGQFDVFLARLTQSGGVSWVQAYGDTTAEQVMEVVVDAAGDIVLSGRYAGAPSFGGDAFPSSNMVWSPFVAKLDGAGQHHWSHGYAVAVDARAFAVAADDQQRVYVGGTFADTMTVGTHELDADPPNLGHRNGFLLQLAP